MIMIVAAVVALSHCIVQSWCLAIQDCLDAARIDINALINGRVETHPALCGNDVTATNHRSTEHSQPDKDAFAFVVEGTHRARRTALPVFITSAGLGGCASHGAPSFELFGAFFPAWMFCALIGIFGGIAARGIFVAAGLNNVLPFQLFVCSSVGLVIAALTWLIWFGR